jgi:hypothetical protein
MPPHRNLWRSQAELRRSHPSSPYGLRRGRLSPTDFFSILRTFPYSIALDSCLLSSSLFHSSTIQSFQHSRIVLNALPRRVVRRSECGYEGGSLGARPPSRRLRDYGGWKGGCLLLFPILHHSNAPILHSSLFLLDLHSLSIIDCQTKQSVTLSTNSST